MAEILKLIGQFIRSVEHVVAGTPGDGGLIQALREPREEFKKKIRQTAPDFRPLECPRAHVAQVMPVLPLPSFLSNEEPESEWQPVNGIRAIFVDDVMTRANS
jgi:hypothetical protein